MQSKTLQERVPNMYQVTERRIDMLAYPTKTWLMPNDGVAAHILRKGLDSVTKAQFSFFHSEYSLVDVMRSKSSILLVRL
jgi:hypothetical protein